MTMRKLCATLLCLMLIAGLAACGAVEPKDPGSAPPQTQAVEETYAGFPGAPASFEGMAEATLQPYFELARETLRRYVMAVHFPQGAPELPRFPMPMTPPLRKYTGLRFENDTRHITESRPVTVSTGIDGWSVIGGKLLCRVSVAVTLRYIDMDSDSVFGQGAQLLIENPQAPTLADWFEFGQDLSSRDAYMRGLDGPEQNLDDPANWLGSCTLREHEDEIYG
jgi:predicted small lipoprotein YifL